MNTQSKTRGKRHRSLLTPLFFLLFSLLLAPVTMAIPAPANGDPCGPAVQDNPNYPNTCNLVPVLGTAPAPYSINCTADEDVVKYPLLAIDWSNCSVSLADTCTKMVDFRTLTGRWIQNSLAPGCVLSFFLPPFPGSAPRPTAKRCADIFTAMANTCQHTNPQANIAGMNLATIPGLDPSYFVGNNVGKGYPSRKYGFTGNAVNVGYPSYLISLNNDLDLYGQ